MRRKDVMKKGKAWLLTATLLVGLLHIAGTPTTVQAETGETTETTTAKTIAGLGTSVIADPVAPSADTDEWKGSYVYFGNYDADGDGTAESTKYRVLDANTTRFSKADDDGNKAETMLLDCDKILYYQKIDNDGIANEGYTEANDWAGSDVKSSLNGDDFLNKDGVFTTAEKSAIAQSTIAAHALTTDSTADGAVNVADGIQYAFANYVPLAGEKIFLLDVEDVFNNAYGYSTTSSKCGNRKKSDYGGLTHWWLRSGEKLGDCQYAGCVFCEDGVVGSANVDYVYIGSPNVSPALNLNLSSVIFTSVISGTSGETGTEYKLTLKDSDMSIATGDSVTRSGNTVTVPYTISGNNKSNATQVSVLILDKEYEVGNTNGASILAYEKLEVDSISTSGTGTFTLPNTVAYKTSGSDYYTYIIVEDVNEEKETDYASELVAITIPGEATEQPTEIKKYIVKFVDGDRIIDTQRVSEGMSAVEPGITKTGYTLYWDDDFDEVYENMIINAEWVANDYKVKFNAAGGRVYEKSMKVTYHEEYGEMPEAERSGYLFDGWYTKKNGGEEISESTVMNTAKTHTLYAHWEKVTVPKISIRYLSSLKKGISVAMNAGKGEDGCQIMYSANKNFRSYKKINTSDNVENIKKLKSRTKYYVKVRGYVYDSKGKKVYGAWSKVNKITVK